MRNKKIKSEYNIDKILDELNSFEELELPSGFSEELEKKLIIAKEELDFEKNGIYYNRLIKKESFNSYIWKRVSAIAAVFLFFIVGTLVIKTEWSMPSSGPNNLSQTEQYGINSTQDSRNGSGDSNDEIYGTSSIISTDGNATPTPSASESTSASSSPNTTINPSSEAKLGKAPNQKSISTPTIKVDGTPTPTTSPNYTLIEPGILNVKASEIVVFKDNNNYFDFAKNIITTLGGKMIYSNLKDEYTIYDFEISKVNFEDVLKKLLDIDNIKKAILAPQIEITNTQKMADANMTSNMKNIAENLIIRIIINK